MHGIARGAYSSYNECFRRNAKLSSDSRVSVTTVALQWVPSHSEKQDWSCPAPLHTTQARRANQLADEACTAEMNRQRARGGQLIEHNERELERKLEWADAAHKVARRACNSFKEYFRRNANLSSDW